MLKLENAVTVERERERERESYTSNEAKISFCFDAKKFRG